MIGEHLKETQMAIQNFAINERYFDGAETLFHRAILLDGGIGVDRRRSQFQGDARLLAGRHVR